MVHDSIVIHEVLDTASWAHILNSKKSILSYIPNYVTHNDGGMGWSFNRDCKVLKSN